MAKSELVVEQTIHPLAVQQEQYMGLIQMAVEKNWCSFIPNKE